MDTGSGAISLAPGNHLEMYSLNYFDSCCSAKRKVRANNSIWAGSGLKFGHQIDARRDVNSENYILISHAIVGGLALQGPVN